MLLCVTVTHFPLAYTTFRWPLDVEVRITNSKVMTGSSLSLYFNWRLLHIYTHPPPLHTYSFTNMNIQMTWSYTSYCLRNTICEPCRFPIVLLPGKVTSAGFKRSQLNVRLQSITDISPIALLCIVCYKIIFLDSVHNQVWLVITRRLYTLKQMNKTESFWQNKKVCAVYHSLTVTDKWNRERWIHGVEILTLWKSPNTLTAN